MSRVIKQEHVTRNGQSYFVSTVRLSVEHPGGMWFETYIFPSDGEQVTNWCEVWGQRFATEREAIAAHPRVVADLIAGKIEL